MSDQRYPDGEFAKAAISLAQTVQHSYKEKKATTQDEFLNLVAACVRALKGQDQ